MYKRTDDGVSKLWMYSTFVLGAIVIILNVVVVYGFRNSSDSTSDQLSESIQSYSQPQNVPPENLMVLGQTTVKPSTQGAVPTEEVTSTATMDMPEGWASGAVESRPDPCGSSEPIKVSVYSKDTVTIKMHEIASTENCTPISVQDVSLNYSFIETNRVIKIASENFAFCSKDQNPACPKGDGKVSAYISNINQQTNQHNQSILTKKSYVFEAIDSSVSADTDAQIRNMAEIIQSSFKIQ